MARIIEVKMRDNKTGEVRAVKYELDWIEGDAGDSHWFWIEGNFGCDCNRGLIWSEWREETECGIDRFFIIDVLLDDGRRVQIDEE